MHTETAMKSVWLDTVTIKTIMTLTQYAWIIKGKIEKCISIEMWNDFVQSEESVYSDKCKTQFLLESKRIITLNMERGTSNVKLLKMHSQFDAQWSHVKQAISILII